MNVGKQRDSSSLAQIVSADQTVEGSCLCSMLTWTAAWTFSDASEHLPASKAALVTSDDINVP